ncbi:MAG: c-type cytochrome [Parazoarcus communis]
MRRFASGLVVAVLMTAGAAAPPALAADAASGKARYQYILNCAGCHQPDGSGAKSGGVPTMRGQLGHFVSLPEGREFLVKVPGTSNSPLSDADVARMLNWMLHAFSAETLPAGLEPYSEAEVSRLRSQPLTDVTAARRAIVARLAERGVKVE